MHRVNLLAPMLCLGLLLGFSSPAAQRSRFPTAGDFSLEILDHNGQPRYSAVHIDVPVTGIFSSFQRLKNWQRPQAQEADASAIKMTWLREGETVRLEVSVLFGPFDPLDTPHSLEGVREEFAGTYLASLGESLRLQNLAQFGIEPITVKVVSAKSPLPTAVEIENRTEAVQVLGIDEARDRYLLTLRNVSTKDITALQLFVPKRGGRTSQLELGAPGRPVIASGQVFEAHVSIGRSGRSTPRGYVPDQPEPVKIVIGGIVFQDSTFEGDVETALWVAAGTRGQKIQLSHLIVLLQQAIESAEWDAGKVIDDLRQQIAALSEEADAEILRELASSFPPLTETQQMELRRGLRGGLNTAKQLALSGIREYERGDAKRNVGLRTWLVRIKSEYEEMIGRM